MRSFRQETASGKKESRGKTVQRYQRFFTFAFPEISASKRRIVRVCFSSCSFISMFETKINL